MLSVREYNQVQKHNRRFFYDNGTFAFGVCFKVGICEIRSVMRKVSDEVSMKKIRERVKQINWLSYLSFLLLAVCIVGAVICYQKGLFTSVEALQEQMDKTGIQGAFVFILIQAIQVVIPIIPGGISCLAGVVLFGAMKGFLWNYIGICIGSIAAFYISRHCGKPILRKLFNQKLFDKYEKWTDEKFHFTKFFAIAIFLPVAPDDFLCYLAGTTSMKWKHFIAIILCGKPFAIAAYSLGLYSAFQTILA